MASSKPVVAICLACVGGCTFFTLRSRATDGYTSLEHVDDEEAPDRSGTQRARAPRAIGLVGAVCTLLVSGWLSLRDVRLESLLLTSGWVLVVLQAIMFVREPSSVRRFDMGLLVAASCLALVVGAGFTAYVAAYDASGLAAEVVAAGVTALAALSVPRQRVLVHKGTRVDAQESCSALSRYTFSWVRPLLDQARAQGTLDYDSLPALHRATRSSTLHGRFALEPSKSLWRLVIADHWPHLVKQWALTAVESFLLICPQLCLFKLLSLLEARHGGVNNDKALWFWAVALVVVKTTHLFCESWIEWINFALIATPIRSQLTALVYTKSMRLKDVKIMDKTGPTTQRQSLDDDKEYEMDTLLPDDDEEGGEKAADEPSEAAQGAINLLGVDVQRVSDFAGYNVLIPGSLLKIIIAMCFLVKLIGWWSTIAGLSVPLIFQPLNQVATRGYSSASEAVMMTRDEKTHIVTEALHGLRQIKFSAIEPQWQRVIMGTRERELAAQWRAFMWATFMVFTWLSMPILLGAAALGTYAWLNGTVTASVAFTALSVFTSLEWTLSVVPTTVTELIDAKISIKRIEQHLKQPNERKPATPANRIAFESATVRWPSEVEHKGAFALRELNLEFPNEQFSVVHGKTGTGKSLLLVAILGEADVISGRVHAPKPPPPNERQDHRANADEWIIPSAMAFVGQIPWIENASLKNNIIFHLPFWKERYQKVLDACALTKDLEMLPDGEETEIGAAGINLSGGQRWRVTLARALYSRAGNLVLDDIFSAVDAHVGRHILTNALHGELIRGRTTILVTHHVGLVLPFASYVVELDEDGHVRSAVTQQPRGQDSNLSLVDVGSSTILSDGNTDPGPMNDVPLEASEVPKPAPKKFVEEEVREQGKVKFAVYKTYMGASGGPWYWAMLLGVYVLSALSMLGRSYWVKHWTQQSNRNRAMADSEQADKSGGELRYYLSVYLGISAFAALSIAVKTLILLRASIRASRKLFQTVTYNVLRAPLRWLDTVPVGRILNRFVSDFALVDARLAGDLNWSAHGVLSVIMIICAALFVSGYMIFPIVALGITCLYYTNIYLDGARDIKRLESTAKSPIFELLGSSLTGLATIRSFGQVDYYIDAMFLRIDDYGRSTWNLLLAARWMALRQGLFGNVFTFFVAAAVILLSGIDASLAGFTLGFALEYSNVAIQTIGRYTGFELDMNSAERIAEYTSLSTEDQSGDDAPEEWPPEGRLDVRALGVSYAPDLPLVLKGVTFTVQARQRVGVVGRTGSGKSSLTLALFRFLVARTGSISIDGLDISKIKLQDLRSRLAIIPQDPVLFSGTLRSNLDPFNNHTDAEVVDVLRRVRLLDGDEEHNVNIFRNLDSQISRGGLNLSQGQRQLLCLARAMVRRPRLIVLDEATSAVDMATDALIQRSIREEFKTSTLIVIAHRLSTIADFDKVLVLDEGQVVEFDDPATLLKKRGAFWEMLNKSGEKDVIEKSLLSL